MRNQRRNPCFPPAGARRASLLSSVLLSLLFFPPLLADDADAFVSTAVAAGDYLIRVQDDDGRFRYLYDPAKPETTEPYNWLRHAGTGYALSQLYRVTGEERFRQGTVRAAEHLVSAVTSLTVEERSFVVVLTDLLPKSNTDRGKLVKTGGVALGILSFWAADQVSDKPVHRERMRALGEYLLFVQEPTGSFRSYYLVQRKIFDTTRSEYYPGQALLALALLEEEMPDERFRDAMTRALAERVELWTRRPRKGGFDHWGLIGAGRALPLLTDAELQKGLGRSRDEVLSVLVAYGEAELATQAPDGSFAAKVASAPATATRLEGIHAVRRLLRRSTAAEADEGEPGPGEHLAAVAAWEPAIRRTQRFLLTCPYPPRLLEAFADGPVDIRGGFRDDCGRGKTGPLRIDNSQHGISALIGDLSPY